MTRLISLKDPVKLSGGVTPGINNSYIGNQQQIGSPVRGAKP